MELALEIWNKHIEVFEHFDLVCHNGHSLEDETRSNTLFNTLVTLNQMLNLKTKLDMSTNDKLKNETVNDTKPTLDAVDVKYLGVPNICFSLTNKDDKREIDFIKQRIERGFDDSETWSLRDSIALFILPRLKRYQEIANDFLKRDDELINDIDCFIKAMELVCKDDGSCIHTPEEEKQMFEGLEKFPKIFMSLWW